MRALIHVDLIVSQMQRSIDFYCKHFDATVAEDVILEGTVAHVTSGGRTRTMRVVLLRLSELGSMIELMELHLPPDQGVRQRLWSKVSRAGAAALDEVGGGIRNFALLVDRLEPTLERLAQSGVRPICEIVEVRLPRLGPSRITYVRDPDGHLIELVDVPTHPA